MNSVNTLAYRKAFAKLPPHIKIPAKKAYKLWQKDPYNSSLQFKQIHTRKPIYSVRVGISWRAIGVKEDNTMIWFWIGSHSDYDQMIASL